MKDDRKQHTLAQIRLLASMLEVNDAARAHNLREFISELFPLKLHKVTFAQEMERICSAPSPYVPAVSWREDGESGRKPKRFILLSGEFDLQMMKNTFFV